MSKGLIIFDMDGTIADTSSGIYASYRHVAKYLGRPEPSNSVLSGVIGGALPSNLQSTFSLNDDQIDEAVGEYRNYYASSGYLESTPYEGFVTTAKELQKRGYTLSVATMKAEIFAKKLIKMWGLESTFALVYGVDAKDTISKPEMIQKCISKTKIDIDNTCLVGDSPQDYQSALKTNIRFIAATYGFHYTEEECINSGIQYITHITSLLNIFE